MNIQQLTATDPKQHWLAFFKQHKLVWPTQYNSTTSWSSPSVTGQSPSGLYFCIYHTCSHISWHFSDGWYHKDYPEICLTQTRGYCFLIYRCWNLDGDSNTWLHIYHVECNCLHLLWLQWWYYILFTLQHSLTSSSNMHLVYSDLLH